MTRSKRTQLRRKRTRRKRKMRSKREMRKIKTRKNNKMKKTRTRMKIKINSNSKKNRKNSNNRRKRSKCPSSGRSTKELSSPAFFQKYLVLVILLIILSPVCHLMEAQGIGTRLHLHLRLPEYPWFFLRSRELSS